MFYVRIGKTEDVTLGFSCGETGNLMQSNLQSCHNERGVTPHICFRVTICLQITLE